MGMSQKQRYTLVVLSLLQGLINDMKVEIEERKVSKQRDKNRKEELLMGVNSLEDELTNFQELYNKSELTSKELGRVTQAMTIMELALSGCVPENRLRQIFIEVSNLIPEAKRLIERNHIWETFN